jgi:ribosomal-protein-alanine N-acetyltransferase
MIATRRLVLRAFTAADVPKLFAMSQEAGMRRWIPDQVYRDEAHAAEVESRLAAFTAQPPDPRVRPFVLGIELDGVLVGHVGLSAARGSVEIGYAVEDERQGRGIASEAVRAIAEWALDELALPEVLGIVGKGNIASCRVLEKAGFVMIGSGIYRRTR